MRGRNQDSSNHREHRACLPVGRDTEIDV
jgi:hypothetical protein